MTEHLRKIVNASGFAFQLAVEESVCATTETHEWEITSREHGWLDGPTPRFADLVLTRGRVRLVIECKRTKEADWIFLVPISQARSGPRRHLRTFYTRPEDSANGPFTVTSLANFQSDPSSWESSFCTVHGSGEDHRPMLDRICAELTRSADQIALQQVAIESRKSFGRMVTDRSWVTVPVIVTNAKLHVCQFDPKAVPLNEGELPADAAKWQTTQQVRYRKSFDAPAPTPDFESLTVLEAARQRTVLVVGAEALPTLLLNLNITPASYGG